VTVRERRRPVSEGESLYGEFSVKLSRADILKFREGWRAEIKIGYGKKSVLARHSRRNG
jgi:hypothetical protein